MTMMNKDHQGGTAAEEGPAREEGVAEGIERLFSEATASGQIGGATEAEAEQILKEGLEKVERDNGLNVLPFPARTPRRSTTGTEGGEA